MPWDIFPGNIFWVTLNQVRFTSSCDREYVFSIEGFLGFLLSVFFLPFAVFKFNRRDFGNLGECPLCSVQGWQII